MIHSLYDNRKGRSIVAAIENGYSAHCIRPLPEAVDGRRLVILIRQERRREYLPAVSPLIAFPLTEWGGSLEGRDLEEICISASGQSRS